MADKETKQFLKEAVENIKKKEFDKALKDVNKVLNKDKNNYKALLFSGLCLSELNQAEKALQMYKKATEVDPEQGEGWKGLAKFYEGQQQYREENSQHYREVLIKLLEFYHQDPIKYNETCGKLAQVELSLGDLDSAIGTLQRQAEMSRENTDLYRDSCEALIKVLSNQSQLTENQTEIFLQVLNTSVTDSQTPSNLENSKHQIKLLYKLRRPEDAFERALAMARIFPENIYPLEWVCKLYLEHTSGALIFQFEEKNICPVYTKLQQLSSSSVLGKLAEGAESFARQQYSQAVTVLREAREVSISSPNVYGLYLLTLALHYTGQHCKVEEQGLETLRHLNKVRESNVRDTINRRLVTLIVRALYHQGSQHNLELAAKLIEEEKKRKEGEKIEGGAASPSLGEGEDLDPLAARVWARLGREGEVEGVLGGLGQDEQGLVRGLLASALGKEEAARKLLEERLAQCPDCPESLIALATLLWDQHRDKSVPLFLRAARVSPSSPLPFLYLGHHYSGQGEPNRDKARKCYLKCLQLHPTSSEAGKALSDLYRVMGKWEDNLALLQTFTKGTAGSWANLRLGLHYLAIQDPHQAVSALQTALRSDQHSKETWEALADAYLARGSFTAAKKAFERVLVLSPTSSYPRVMIAGIKLKQGLHREAVMDYRDIQTTFPDHLPALRGEGESLAALGRSYLEQGIDSNVLDCVRDGLSVLTQAAKLRPGLAGTWALLGEVAGLVSVLHRDTVGEMMVPGCLVQAGGEGVVGQDREEVLGLAVRCYTRALALVPSSAGLWHQLGVIHAALQDGAKAVGALRQCVALAPRQAAHWTSLGAEYARQEEWARAQHCLITALDIETSAVTWTNLGAVYAVMGETKLANMAFKEAQAAQPDYVRGWAGQALVAEVAGYKAESLDLLRHCTFLGQETESARGYGGAVTGVLHAMDRGDTVETHSKYIVENMWGTRVAVDSLTTYCARNPGDAGAWCHLGVLQERLGLLRNSLQSLQEARKVLDAESGTNNCIDSVLANLGRVLTRLGRPEEAVSCYTAMEGNTLRRTAGLALAQYKLGDYQAAYSSYSSCLNWLTEDPAMKSHVLVAMGCLAYRVQGVDAAKTLLFQSCQLQPPSVRGLFALCVIGIQQSDITLIEAALSEMVPHHTNPRLAPDIAFLRASVLVLKGELAAARKSVLCAVHSQPWLARMWDVVSVFLLQNSPRDARVAAHLATKARRMDQSGVGQDLGLMETRDGQETEVLTSLALLMAGDTDGALRQAQVAVHTKPQLAETWAVLAAAGKLASRPLSWLQSVLDNVRRLSSPSSSSSSPLLHEWATRVLGSL